MTTEREWVTSVNRLNDDLTAARADAEAWKDIAVVLAEAHDEDELGRCDCAAHAAYNALAAQEAGR